ncbi:MAG: cell wall hydrolase [Heliobacteriaceae bacterium]|nr:cell wall hydrolase [Heliobacteriaceae bacterium]MDD4586813.1 cell wall hydrolase [Heliobacteriaceae bacterium]
MSLRLVSQAWRVLLLVALGIFLYGALPVPAHAWQYTVSAGDTYYLLGERFGLPWEIIQVANNLPADNLPIGQVLTIPDVNTLASRSIPATQEDIDLLARLIEAEASGEPYSGKVGVGMVILNRVDSDLFPNTIREVIFEPWQFEPVQNGWIYFPATAESFQAAQDALDGVNPVNDALYFFNPDKTADTWMHQRPIICRIGNHLFTQ